MFKKGDELFRIEPRKEDKGQALGLEKVACMKNGAVLVGQRAMVHKRQGLLVESR